MPMGRPKAELVLTPDEREMLERWARRPTTAQALAQRARIVLSCTSGKGNDTVAREEGVTRQTVGRWRHRFVTSRADGLLDEALRAEPDRRQSHLACVRPATPPGGDVQAVQGPAVHRESARHRGPLPQPAG